MISWDATLLSAAWMGALAVRLMLAVILAHSAWHALRDVAMHAAIVEQYRLLPRQLVFSAALGLPLASAVAAVALLFGDTARIGLLLGLGLMLLFTGAIGINLARGRREIDCGCGGAEGQRLSSGLLVRNLTLCGLVAAAWFAPTTGYVEASMLIGAVGAAAALVAFYFAVNQLLNNDSLFHAA